MIFNFLSFFSNVFKILHYSLDIQNSGHKTDAEVSEFHLLISFQSSVGGAFHTLNIIFFSIKCLIINALNLSYSADYKTSRIPCYSYCLHSKVLILDKINNNKKYSLFL